MNRGTEYLEDFAGLEGVKFVVIDQDTRLR